MEQQITNIEQLKKGDKIWIIGPDGLIKIMEFVCIHPHNPEYSIFLNSCYDGMPKFYNKRLSEEHFELYDGSDECWERMYLAEIEEHKRRIQVIESRLQEVRNKMNKDERN